MGGGALGTLAKGVVLLLVGGGAIVTGISLPAPGAATARGRSFELEGILGCSIELKELMVGVFVEVPRALLEVLRSAGGGALFIRSIRRCGKSSDHPGGAFNSRFVQ